MPHLPTRTTSQRTPACPLAIVLSLALAGPAAALQETKVETIEGNPPTGNEPWEICPGEYAQTAIDTNVDFDTFRMLGKAGDVWRLGLSSPSGLDPLVQIYDPTGNLHDTASCSNGCSITKELAPLTVGGMYTIIVSDINTDEGGPYTISFERMLPATWVDWLPYNATQSVPIDYNTDTDWIRFWAEAGSSVNLVGNSPTGLDPAVAIYDPFGVLIVTGGCSNGCSFQIPLSNLHDTGEYTACFWDVDMDEGGPMQVTLNCIFDPDGFCTAPPPDGPLGANYCSTATNSTGLPAVLTARGSTVIADDRLYLEAYDVPIAQFGLFFFGTSQEQKPMPPPSQGTLCVGQPLVRGPVLLSCNDGSLRWRPRMGSLPQGVVFQPGETWNFQGWFRDQNPNATSNTSDGLAILFQ